MAGEIALDLPVDDIWPAFAPLPGSLKESSDVGFQEGSQDGAISEDWPASTPLA